MTYVIAARWRSKDGHADAIAAVLRELVPACRKEPGVRMFIANRACDDPNVFLLYEQYVDEQAFRDHQQTPHFKALVLERAVPLLAERERIPYAVLA
jgi:quinol monooxygenase YgiN